MNKHTKTIGIGIALLLLGVILQVVATSPDTTSELRDLGVLRLILDVAGIAFIVVGIKAKRKENTN